MAGFDKKKYAESGVWVNNDYLVDPRDTAKRCICCKERYYTVEFTNCSGFDDNKLPVCGFCLRGNSKWNKTAVRMLNELDKIVSCEVCGADLQLMDIYKKVDNTNTIVATCQGCKRG